MKRTLSEIAADLDSLKAYDFNLANIDAYGMERLIALSSEMAELNMPDEVAEISLRFIERLSTSDEIDPRFDLGPPGPLVHLLEKLPDYEKHLATSLKRIPTPLTVWMINRILNVTENKSKRRYWLQLLKDCQSHPACTSITYDEVQIFLDHQTKNFPNR